MPGKTGREWQREDRTVKPSPEDLPVSINDLDKPRYMAERSHGLRQMPFGGDSEWDRNPNNPIVTTDNSFAEEFAADPWIIYHDGKLWIFFEGRKTDYARIGVATSEDGTNWNVRSDINPVLDAGEHTSWPYVFKAYDYFYMLVSRYGNKWPLLFRTSISDFPLGWSELGVPVSASGTNRTYDYFICDACIIFHDNLWYYIVGAKFSDWFEGPHEMLVYYSDTLDTSGWAEANYNPIDFYSRDRHCTFTVQRINGSLFAFDRNFHLWEIVELSPNSIELRDKGKKLSPPAGGHHLTVARLNDRWIGAFDSSTGPNGSLEVHTATQEVEL